MSKSTTAPEPQPDDVGLLSGSLSLDPDLPSPAEPPRVEELPGNADTVADPIALADLLTGSGDLRDVAASMIGAGAPAEHVAAAVERTQDYSRLVADLLIAVDGVIRDIPDARSVLHAVNSRLAQLEQGRAR